MKKFWYTLFILLLFYFSGFGQVVDTAAVVREVDSLIRIAVELTGKRQLDQAFAVNAAAEQLALEKIGRLSAVYGSACHNRGRVYYFKQDYKEAIKWYQEAISIRGQVLGTAHKDYATSLGTLANVYKDTGQYVEAEKYQTEALAIREKALGKDHPEYAVGLHNLAVLYREMGYFEKALPLHQAALAIREKNFGKLHQDYAISQTSLANVYLEMGRFEEAERLFRNALEIVEQNKGKENLDYCGNIINLATVYSTKSNYGDAERLYREAQSIFETKLQEFKHPYYINCLNNLGILYTQMNALDKAEQFCLEAKSVTADQLGTEHPAYGMCLQNLANVYSKKGNYDQAEAVYREAAEINRKKTGEESPAHAAILVSLAHVYNRKQDFEQAVTFIGQAISILEKTRGKEHLMYAEALAVLSGIYKNLKDSMRAETLLREVKDIREKALGVESDDYIKSLNGLALFYWEQSDYARSAPLLAECSQLSRATIRRAVFHLSEKELFIYVQKFTQRQNQILSFLLYSPKMPEDVLGACYDNQIFYKGFVLQAAGAVRQQTWSDPVALQQFDLLKSYRRRLAREYSKPVARRSNLAELEEQTNTLEKELVRTVAGFGDATRQVNWQDVRSALHPGEAAIEFIHFNYCTPEPTDSVLYAALLLKPGMPHPKFIPLCSEKDLLALLPASGGLNTDQVNALYSGSDELYRLIWAPLEQELQGVRLAYCAPSGLLHRLNLGALPAGTKQTVSDRFQMITLGSTRQLVLDPGAGRAPTVASAIVYGGIRFDADSTALQQSSPTGDPGAASQPRGALTFSLIDSTLRGGQPWPYLKWSDKEADNIRAVLAEAGIAAEVRKGAAATEESFKQIGQSGPSPRILHVSTHGYFFPDPATPHSALRTPHSDEPVFKLSEHPMIRSGLILAGANQAWSTGTPPTHREDGVLTAFEISQLDLRHTELVVLSACETGLGDIQGNEGVYGLQRAFKIAGARHVMMSLWQVPDYQTQELMTVFYKKMLIEQLPVRQALRAAQEAMQGKRYEPYYWAGFVIVE